MNEIIKRRLEEISKLFKKSTFSDNSDFEWNGLEIDEEDYVYVPQGSHLGGTLICFDDNYEDSGHDALLITELLKLAQSITSLQGEI